MEITRRTYKDSTVPLGPENDMDMAEEAGVQELMELPSLYNMMSLQGARTGLWL